MKVDQVIYVMPPNPYKDKKKKKQFKKDPSVRSALTVQLSYVRGQTGQTRTICGTCGKLHFELCRMGQNVCYRCGQPGHFA